MRSVVSTCCDGVLWRGVGDGGFDGGYECIFWQWHDGLDESRLLFLHRVPVSVEQQ